MKERECTNLREHEEVAQKAKAKIWQEGDVEKICNTYRVLGEPSRMKIVLALTEGEMCVYHIVQVCGGTQSAVSHQLRVLKDNRVIKSRREGQNVLYSIADEHIYEMIKLGEEHMSCKTED